ncbi:MAG: hypothetical protein Kow0077_22850 [Anaerolineae bacterium]
MGGGWPWEGGIPHLWIAASATFQKGLRIRARKKAVPGVFSAEKNWEQACGGMCAHGSHKGKLCQ